MPRRLSEEERQLRDGLKQLAALRKVNRDAARIQQRESKAARAELLKHRSQLAKHLRYAEMHAANAASAIATLTCASWNRGNPSPPYRDPRQDPAFRAQELFKWNAAHARELAHAAGLRLTIELFDLMHCIAGAPT